MRPLSIVLLLALAAPSIAAPQFAITEIYVGIDGEDGTPDWIEVTNLGDMDGDTAGLIYDDESRDPLEMGDLPSFLLSPGESAVFLIEAESTDVALFESIWGTFPNLGFTSGGGSLGAGGDTAAILLSDGTIVDEVTFPAYPADGVSTIQVYPTLGLSTVGVLGAYASNPFFNDNLAAAIDNGNMISLIGSPGTFVPEPASLALAVSLAAAACGRRRR